MQFTNMKILAGLAIGMMASSAIAAPTSAATNISVAPTGASSIVSGTAVDAASTTEVFRFSKAAQNVHDYIKSMNLHPDGSVHVSDDGVARSYDGDGKVIDYRKLDNTQLRQMTSSLPPSLQNQTDHFHDVWDSVNGHDVTDEQQLWNPPAHLRPAEDDTPTEAPSAPQSTNPAHDVASRLDDRSTPINGVPLTGPPIRVCVGSLCQRNSGCVLLGCETCATYDKYKNKQCF